MSSSGVQRGLRLVAGNLLILVALLALGECVARVVAPREATVLFSEGAARIKQEPFVVRHPVRGHALRAGFRGPLIQVNSAGFRGDELPEDLGSRFVIVALGESTTFGWGIANGEDYPAYLGEGLNALEPSAGIEVINAGVPSYSSTQVLLYLKEILSRMQPDVVLLSVLWNDIWYSTLEPWYPEALVFQQPPAWRLFLLRHSGLYRSLALPSPQSVERSNRFNQRAFEHFQENIRAVIELCREAQTTLIFVQPPISLTHIPDDGINPFQHVRITKPFLIATAHTYLDALRSIAKESEIPTFDHRLSIRSDNPRKLFRDELHPSKLGNRMIAEDVATSLSRGGFLRR